MGFLQVTDKQYVMHISPIHCLQPKMNQSLWLQSAENQFWRDVNRLWADGKMIC